MLNWPKPYLLNFKSMLLSSFFTIDNIEDTDKGFVSHITLNGAHEIYEGHFPQNPVTPGVIQLQLVKELLETKLNKSLTLNTMSRCKYLKVLDPRSTPNIQISIEFTASSTPENPSVSASGQHGDDVFFKFNATYL